MEISDRFTDPIPAPHAHLPAAMIRHADATPRWDSGRCVAWQAGLDLFCAAAGTRSAGIVVLRRNGAGHVLVAELGWVDCARLVWHQDGGDNVQSDGSDAGGCTWRRIMAQTADPQASLWGCRLFDSGTYCAYIGLESDRLLTDRQLQLLSSHVRRYCRALEKDLWLAPWVAASPSPIELASEASRQFGLTPAEHMVLRELLSGTPAKRIATRRGVEVNTIRSQIKSIYGKLDVHRACEIYARLRQHAAVGRMN